MDGGLVVVLLLVQRQIRGGILRRGFRLLKEGDPAIGVLRLLDQGEASPLPDSRAQGGITVAEEYTEQDEQQAHSGPLSGETSRQAKRGRDFSPMPSSESAGSCGVGISDVEETENGRLVSPSWCGFGVHQKGELAKLSIRGDGAVDGR